MTILSKRKIYSIMHCYLQVYKNAMQRLDENSDTNVGVKAFGIGFPVLAFSSPFIFLFCSYCLEIDVRSA